MLTDSFKELGKLETFTTEETGVHALYPLSEYQKGAVGRNSSVCVNGSLWSVADVVVGRADNFVELILRPAGKNMERRREPKAEPHYKIVSISLYTGDIENMEKLITDLKGNQPAGPNYTKSNLLRQLVYLAINDPDIRAKLKDRMKFRKGE